MKKHIVSLAMGLAIFCFANANPRDNSKASAANERAQKNFHKEHRDVTNGTWYALQDGFKVEFTQDGRETRSVYGKRGNWLYTIKYYKADNLDKDLIDIVKT